MVLNVKHVYIKVKNVDINGISMTETISAVEAFGGGTAAADVAPTHVHVCGKATILCECLLFLLFFVGGAVEAGVLLLVVEQLIMVVLHQFLVLSGVRSSVVPHLRWLGHKKFWELGGMGWRGCMRVSLVLNVGLMMVVLCEMLMVVVMVVAKVGMRDNRREWGGRSGRDRAADSGVGCVIGKILRINLFLRLDVRVSLGLMIALPLHLPVEVLPVRNLVSGNTIRLLCGSGLLAVM